MWPSPAGKRPSKATLTLPHPTFWEPRSPLNSPPLQHPTGPPGNLTVAEAELPVAVDPDSPPPVPVTSPTLRSEPTTPPPASSGLFPPLQRTTAPPPEHLLHRLPMWHTRDYGHLPDSPPPTVVSPELPSPLENELIRPLDLVLHDPQPVLVTIAGQPIVAVVQDVIEPPDLLLQALKAADVPMPLHVHPSPPASELSASDHPSSSSSLSSTETEEEDTWAAPSALSLG
ncbi:proline-rich cell wall protein, putative [Ixodes scapularis]|uniref:Proline-rich cell wall protein, putative n=1 Tax=Ixodes scapularis TaxID=6945 RepID=B7Q0H3_IXOSC|nr:proline-rich cell wall protein, putative [Ixodes scapularis]|eukprot:XP_002407688.1 proline-rich cell wall protein, putative [Ixodes scapularis]